MDVTIDQNTTYHQLYAEYHIPRQLQQHMLRVVAVADTLIQEWRGEPIDTAAVITAAYLHDMGNIVKFRPPFLGEMAADEAVWLEVQQQFHAEYGFDAHKATLAVVSELRAAAQDHFGSASQENSPWFTQIQAARKLIADSSYESLETQGFTCDELRVLVLADMCVAPDGVVQFSERMADLQERYTYKKNDTVIQLLFENKEVVERYLSSSLADITARSFEDLLENYGKRQVLTFEKKSSKGGT